MTTEETITAAVARLSQIALKNCKVIRDDATATSKGFCFVELNSIQVGKRDSYHSKSITTFCSVNVNIGEFLEIKVSHPRKFT